MRRAEGGGRNGGAYASLEEGGRLSRNDAVGPATLGLSGEPLTLTLSPSEGERGKRKPSSAELAAGWQPGVKRPTPRRGVLGVPFGSSVPAE